MDINYLLEREQIERVRAVRAECDRTRASHSGMADAYRRLIEDYRRRGAAARSLTLRPLFG
jgi:hypothetical protein